MLKLLIIADDLTGALDTGVQFSDKGIETRVIIADTEKKLVDMSEVGNVDVLVADVETRHMNPQNAYDKVFRIVSEAIALGIPHIYKKTDSALRGNIGSELSALLAASNERVLPFVPAFPKMGRITKEGIHYVEGVPVSASVFGQDPFEPVSEDSVKQIIGLQSDVSVNQIANMNDPHPDAGGIWVFDSSTDEDIEKAAVFLKETNRCHILAGCAGLASVLPKILELKENPCLSEKLERKLLMVCGSVNPITRKQIAYGETIGYEKISLSVEEKLDRKFWDTERSEAFIQKVQGSLERNYCIIIDSNDSPESGDTLEYASARQISTEQIRRYISENLGVILRKVLDTGIRAVILVTGGDTLFGLMKEIRQWELKPVCEVVPGCVVAKLYYKGYGYHIITKSGGFGTEGLLEDIINILNHKES